MAPETKIIDAMWGVVAELTRRQSEALIKNIAISFTMGFKNSGTKAPLSQLQKDAIRGVSKVNLGAIKAYNDALGTQMEAEIKRRIAAGGGYDEVSQDLRKYITETFGDNGVTIDRTGQTRTVIEIGKDGTLRKVEKTITQPYTSTVQNYSDMLSRTTVHSSYEHGRLEGYKKQGVEKLRFVGPNDERARPWHVAVLGNVFEIGSDEEEKYMSLLSEPHCRHRTIPYFDDPDYDTPQLQ